MSYKKRVKLKCSLYEAYGGGIATTTNSNRNGDIKLQQPQHAAAIEYPLKKGTTGYIVDDKGETFVVELIETGFRGPHDLYLFSQIRLLVAKQAFGYFFDPID